MVVVRGAACNLAFLRCPAGARRRERVPGGPGSTTPTPRNRATLIRRFGSSSVLLDAQSRTGVVKQRFPLRPRPRQVSRRTAGVGRGRPQLRLCVGDLVLTSDRVRQHGWGAPRVYRVATTASCKCVRPREGAVSVLNRDVKPSGWATCPLWATSSSSRRAGVRRLPRGRLCAGSPHGRGRVATARSLLAAVEQRPRPGATLPGIWPCRRPTARLRSAAATTSRQSRGPADRGYQLSDRVQLRTRRRPSGEPRRSLPTFPQAPGGHRRTQAHRQGRRSRGREGASLLCRASGFFWPIFIALAVVIPSRCVRCGTGVLELDAVELGRRP